MTGTANATPKPRSAIVLSVCVLALFIAEAFWLANWHRLNEELAIANARRAGQNAIEARKVLELRSAAVRIDGLYLRLQDPSASTPQGAQRPPNSGTGPRPAGTEPMAIQDFVKGGLMAYPSGSVHSESSVGYQLGSDQLEFHRLIPLIAQEENSNVFLFIDHLELLRPKVTGPFSMKPTALQSRLTARMFTTSTTR
jgi:hypothetical protein